MNIAKVSEHFNTPAHTLRFYEKAGLIPRVERKNGIRDYNESDLEWIGFIKCMRSAGLPVKSLQEYVRLFDEGNKTNAQRKEILIKQRIQLKAKIDDMKNILDILNHKIEIYDTKIIAKEQAMRNNKGES